MRTTKARKTLAIAAAGASVLAIPVIAGASSGSEKKDGPKDKRLIVATDDKGNLLAFRADRPSKIRAKAITGLPVGVTLRGIDFRPRTGDLYGVGSDKVVYRVNPQTALAIAEGPTFDSAGTVTGTNFGWDFNPTVDKIRGTTDAQDNIRLDPDSGAMFPVAGTEDGALNPGTPLVVGSAYINSSFSATPPAATVLFAYETGMDKIHIQAPPNSGTLNAGVAFGVNLGSDVGFDIAGASNTGYIAGPPAGKAGARLWRVDVQTGARTSLGKIGYGKVNVTGLAVWQDQS